MRETCLHCGLPLTAVQRRRNETFCCGGCERVYALIHEEGLERYYDLRRGSVTPPSGPRAGSFAWLDALMPAAGDPNAARRLTLDVQGIHCAACVWILEELFRRHDGGLDLRINPSLGKADLAWIPAKGDLRAWLAEAERFGYRFGPSRKTAARKSAELLVRLGISVAAAMNVMIFSLSYYLGLAPDEGALYALFGKLNFTLALVSVSVGGWVFFKAAALGLRRGLAHLDLPIAVGILLAFAGSTYSYLKFGPEAAYFDTVTIFVALMLIGRWLQEFLLERNRNALLADTGIDNLYARRFRDGALESIPVADLRRGDELWIVPGDFVPVDAILVEHPAEVALDWITGESDVRGVDAGEMLPAGAINAGHTTMRAAAGEDFATSNLNDLLGSPSVARDGSGAEGQRWWRRVSAIYVTAVFALAALGFALWVGRGFDKAVQVTVAVLVVTCPCALGLATPLAHELMHLALRKRGVFVRGGGFMDRALGVRKVIFDKTGTLTLGRLELSAESAETLADLAAGDRAALFDLTARSNHPVSRALAEALRVADPLVSVAADREVTETAGQGLAMTVDGHEYRLGRPAFDEHRNRAETAFTADGRTLAVFTFEEQVRSDAEEEVRRLGEAGYEVYVLSGDSPGKVLAVAGRLGVPRERVHGGMTPEAKAEWIRSVDRRDTLMVGDGLNDGPGLEAATCAATPAVDHPSLPSRADFYFLGEGVAAVRRALLGARRLRSVVWGNLTLAIAYNALALVLCYLGLVTPVVAAILMPVSSVSVVTLTSFRLSGRRLAWMS